MIRLRSELGIADQVKDVLGRFLSSGRTGFYLIHFGNRGIQEFTEGFVLAIEQAHGLFGIGENGIVMRLQVSPIDAGESQVTQADTQGHTRNQAFHRSKSRNDV